MFLSHTHSMQLISYLLTAKSSPMFNDFQFSVTIANCWSPAGNFGTIFPDPCLILSWIQTVRKKKEHVALSTTEPKMDLFIFPFRLCW